MSAKMKMTLQAARKLDISCVYLILDDAGKPVYIGRSKNVGNRFEVYAHKNCHNSGLNAWLYDNPNPMVELRKTGDTHKLELNLIRRHQKRLFNKASANNTSWQTHRTKPWLARTGAHCPSSLVLYHTAKTQNLSAERAGIRKMRDAMSDKDRAQFEVSTAMALLSTNVGLRDRVALWLEMVGDDILEFLESDGVAVA